jgi:hypothetical protein
MLMYLYINIGAGLRPGEGPFYLDLFYAIGVEQKSSNDVGELKDITLHIRINIFIFICICIYIYVYIYIFIWIYIHMIRR